MMTQIQLLMRIAQIENIQGRVNWYNLRHWDQEITPNPAKALQALAEQGYLEELPEHPNWYHLTAKGRASLP